MVKENNELHMSLILAKEQVQSLEHRVYKSQANQHSDQNELSKLASMKSRRE